MRIAFVGIASLALLTSPFMTPSAAADPVVPGERVRVSILERVQVENRHGPSTLEPGTRLTGKLLFVTPDTIALHDVHAGQPRVLSRASLGGIEQGMANGTHWGKGAMVGGIIGGLAGIAFGAYYDSWEGTAPGATVILGGYGLAGGLALGGFIGSTQKRIEWSPAELPLGPTGLPAGDVPAAIAVQSPPPPQLGERVRVTLLGESPAVGRLIDVESEALTLDAGADTARLVLSKASITALETEHRQNHSRAGAIIGFVVGGVTARAIHASISSHEDFSDVPPGSFLFGGMVGAMAGHLVGRKFNKVHWEEASLP